MYDTRQQPNPWRYTYLVTYDLTQQQIEAKTQELLQAGWEVDQRLHASIRFRKPNVDPLASVAQHAIVRCLVCRRGCQVKLWMESHIRKELRYHGVCRCGADNRLTIGYIGKSESRSQFLHCER